MADAQAWLYSDWDTHPPGNATRLSQLRLHVKEIRDKLVQGDFSTADKAHSYGVVLRLYELTKRDLDLEEQRQLGAAFVRAKVKR